MTQHEGTVGPSQGIETGLDYTCTSSIMAMFHGQWPMSTLDVGLRDWYVIGIGEGHIKCKIIQIYSWPSRRL